jgi:hypothetical protein
VLHQIGRPTGPLQIVQSRLDDLDDPRLEPAHPTHRELRGEHPAQPRVLRRVEPDQLPGLHLGQLVGVHLPRPRERRQSSAEPGRIRQHLANILLTADQVRGHAERRLHPHHTLTIASPGQLLNRVEPVPPHMQRQFPRFRHLQSIHPVIVWDRQVRRRTGVRRLTFGVRCGATGLRRYPSIAGGGTGETL